MTYQSRPQLAIRTFWDFRDFISTKWLAINEAINDEFDD